MKRVLLFGTFDKLHLGHRFVIDQAIKRGEVFIVVGRDKTVLKIKDKTAAHSELERKKAIETAYPEVSVLLGDEEKYETPLKTVNPDLILLGYDQMLPPGIQMEDISCSVERLESYFPDKYKTSKAD
ncbi:adenylyltransferase/cytidyltransferase family protein [Candidatus Peregrinibacteria bacterium]|jgi:cytidyltransferase-like protein|nr:adenylyltransferase/cytidyltransferase family protein [Candidatus Peregrinibacteria bacterium]MBT3598230.1 adenylyltransferase/cytidyltransferase family protein [Candidatus Peregrinibacteria bacterium]MBT4367144.1 adenylyltransferase/cytidyltransferase family protein [Candidatus Peregrinibacteria bacterium]MBT4585367.1 adenylyltransferase/cytidyltransferase family protein [Candidatus Peregrinibacteria bacterium]MBT6730979.1 adenylyltransferase/cytidyltransferase family protein [Candidatus Pe